MPSGIYNRELNQNRGKYAVGTHHLTKYGEVVVLEKLEKQRLVIRFINTGYVCTCKMQNLGMDKVKDQRFPSVYGLGYLDGIKVPSRGVGIRPIYDLWANMLKRVTSDPLYKDISVDTNWLSFKTFLNSVTDIPGYDAWELDHSMHLDKDIRVPGSKVYSLSTCTFVSAKLNMSDASNRRWARVRSAFNTQG